MTPSACAASASHTCLPIANASRHGIGLHTAQAIEHEGLPYIVMELLGGETVLDRLRYMRPMPWRDAFAIGKQVCEALTAAHALGVIHRDLKPGNIFVASGVVKVLDFGIAKILSNSSVGNPQELTIMGTAVGTIEYMAPEQLMGGRADARTDLYTLGVVLDEMVVGKPPTVQCGGPRATHRTAQYHATESIRACTWSPQRRRRGAHARHLRR